MRSLHSKKIQFSHALITGASSGIGKELAFLLAKKNISLLLTGRNEEALSRISRELSAYVPVVCLAADLAKEEGRKKLIELIEAHPVDLLINCAGFGVYGDINQIETEEELKMIEVNVKAVVELSYATAKKWISEKREGVILNISSAVGFFSAPWMGIYAASKAFLIPFSKALDYECRRYGIRVLVSCPGQVATDFVRRAAHTTQPPYQPFAMSDKKAAQEIFWQIEKRKPLHIFDFRYRFLVFFSFFFPNFLVQRLIEKSIKKRQ